MVDSDDVPLLFSGQVDQYKVFQFIFNVLSLTTLAVFALSLPHKMAGAELLSSSQIAYLSLCLHQEPSFLISVLSEFRLVIGSWSLFFREEDAYLLPGFTDRVELSPSFFDSCLTVVGVFTLTFLSWAVLAAVKACHSSSLT